jgi:hypothetical protein
MIWEMVERIVHLMTDGKEENDLKVSPLLFLSFLPN